VNRGWAGPIRAKFTSVETAIPLRDEVSFVSQSAGLEVPILISGFGQESRLDDQKKTSISYIRFGQPKQNAGIKTFAPTGLPGIMAGHNHCAAYLSISNLTSGFKLREGAEANWVTHQPGPILIPTAAAAVPPPIPRRNWVRARADFANSRQKRNASRTRREENKKQNRQAGTSHHIGPRKRQKNGI
jgi:hypothetical protein